MDGMRRVCGTIVLAAALLSLAACGGGGGGAGAGPGASLSGSWSGTWDQTSGGIATGTINDVTFSLSGNIVTGTITFVASESICVEDDTGDVNGTLNGSNLTFQVTFDLDAGVIDFDASLEDPMNGNYTVTTSGTTCQNSWGGTFTLNKQP
jgi:hypothetical protein